MKFPILEYPRSKAMRFVRFLVIWLGVIFLVDFFYAAEGLPVRQPSVDKSVQGFGFFIALLDYLIGRRNRR